MTATTASIEPTSNLGKHAKRELELLGEDPEYAASIVAACDSLMSYGHSGGSAEVARHQLTKLLQFRALTPLTSDPDEWVDRSVESGRPMWQNVRDSSVFSDVEPGPGMTAWRPANYGKERVFIKPPLGTPPEPEPPLLGQLLEVEPDGLPKLMRLGDDGDFIVAHGHMSRGRFVGMAIALLAGDCGRVGALAQLGLTHTDDPREAWAELMGSVEHRWAIEFIHEGTRIIAWSIGWDMRESAGLPADEDADEVEVTEDFPGAFQLTVLGMDV